MQLPIDLKNYGRVAKSRMCVETFAACVTVFLLFTIMGWGCVERKPEPIPHITKDQSVELLTKQLKEETARVNEEMEKRAALNAKAKK